jgi:hypothetical protein
MVAQHVAGCSVTAFWSKLCENRLPEKHAFPDTTHRWPDAPMEYEGVCCEHTMATWPSLNDTYSTQRPTLHGILQNILYAAARLELL